MIHYIKGKLEETAKDYAIVDNNGIGYKIFTSPSTLSRMGGIGEMVKVYTYFHVREDAMLLFGFLSLEELDMFEKLISVSGVGPKAGLAVLSTLSPSRLVLAIIEGDIKSLTSVPGIGSKTAHRIILELKDKVEPEENIDIGDELPGGLHDASSEAVNALIALGYSAAEANDAVSKVKHGKRDAEEVIRDALKILMK